MKFKGKIRLYYSEAFSSLVNQEEIIYDEPITTGSKLKKCLSDMVKEAERRYHMKSYYGRMMLTGNRDEKTTKIKELNELSEMDLMKYFYLLFDNDSIKDECFKGFKYKEIEFGKIGTKDINDFVEMRDFEIHNHIGSENIPPYEFTIKDYFIDKIADLISPTHYLNIDFGSHSHFIIIEFEDREDYYKYVNGK